MGPKVYKKHPVIVELEEGKTYHWCTCGESKQQPFCDGSHVGTNFEPLEFFSDKAQRAHLCLCKHTNNPPYCDGTHTKL